MTALVFILLMCKYVKNMDKVILKVAKYFQSILLIIIFGLIFLTYLHINKINTNAVINNKLVLALEKQKINKSAITAITKCIFFKLFLQIANIRNINIPALPANVQRKKMWF